MCGEVTYIKRGTNSANDLISEEEPNYQFVAAKLLNFKLRKDVWGGYSPPRLFDHIKDLVKLDLYDPSVKSAYTKEEINKLGEYKNILSYF